MNEIRLFAKFEIDPPEEVKQAVENEMRAFFESVAPGIQATLTTGSGSWWVFLSGVATSVPGWFALQFANWVARRGFDRVADNVRRTVGDGVPNTRALVVEAQSTNEEAFERMTLMASKLNGLADRIGATVVVMGEWSEAASLGRVVYLRKTGNEFAFHVYQTDSREDFNSRTTS